jgi:hypothetical protein
LDRRNYFAGRVIPIACETIDDARGALSPIDFSAYDFRPVRAFVVTARPGAVRGAHGHVRGRQILVREAFERIGGIKPHANGEVSADWVWLLHMALLGEFVRVPEVLCQKFYLRQSLSRGWTYDARQYRALRRAGIREVAASRIAAAAVIWRLLRPELLAPYHALRRQASRLAGRAGAP